MYNSEIEYLKNTLNPKQTPTAEQGYKVIINKLGNSSLERLDSHLNNDFLAIMGGLFQLYDRTNYNDIGIVEYIDAHRIFRPQTFYDFQMNMRTDQDRFRRSELSEIKFNYLKILLLKYKLLHLQNIDKASKQKNVNVNEINNKYFDRLNKIFELIPPKRFREVDIGTSPIRFVVDTPLGEIDLDSLSSGEKELLFVFAELLHLELNNSVILFDEPDLHLNEKIQYKIIPLLQNLGKGNQIWITTHSTAIINSINEKNLFRIQDYTGKNQVSPIIDNSRVDLIHELVGDNKSILTLGEKIVFVEGNQYNDKLILERLFDSINDIIFIDLNSVNNIHKINQIILSLIEKPLHYTFFYSIRDRDFFKDIEVEEYINRGKGRLFIWKKYILKII